MKQKDAEPQIWQSGCRFYSLVSCDLLEDFLFFIQGMTWSDWYFTKITLVITLRDGLEKPEIRDSDSSQNVTAIVQRIKSEVLD